MSIKPNHGKIKLIQIDPPVFVAERIISIARMIRPNEPVQCVITDMQSLCKTHEYPLITRYMRRALVQEGIGGPIRSVERAMHIDGGLISRMASEDSLFSRSMCYWSVIFEGVRRFVLEHVLAPDDMLPPRLLSKICDIDSEAELTWERLVHGLYVGGGVNERELCTEIDVQTTALITQAAMMNIVDLRGRVLYEELIPFLTLGKNKLTPEIERGILSFV